MLSIVIPTYRRIKELSRTLEILSPQLIEGVEIIVVNNDDKIDISKLISTQHIKIINNVANIGGNTNILRCIEHASYEYVWVLGDDDIPSYSSIETILYHINISRDVLFFNFSYSSELVNYDAIKTEDNCTIVDSLEEVVKQSPNISNLVFISNNVYNTAMLRVNLDVAHLYQFACAPLLTSVIKYIDNNDFKAVFSRNTIIVGNQDNDRGSPLQSIVGLGILRTMPLAPSNHEIMSQWLDLASKHWYPVHVYLFYLLLFYENSKSRKLIREYSLLVCIGLYKNSTLDRLLIIIFLKCTFAFKFILKILKKFGNNKIKEKLSTIK